jgi:hypothetical protein
MHEGIPLANFPPPPPPPRQINTYNDPEDILIKLKESGAKLKELLNIDDEMIDKAIRAVRRDV